jgi:ubiquinone/menaquinone biosynthesis C-methylase UbiE
MYHDWKHKIERLDSEARKAEMKPIETLKESGLKAGDIFCDIGAGAGIFTFPAAEITGVKTYAVDVSEAAVAYLEEKAKAVDAAQVEVVKAEGIKYPFLNGSVDFTALVTVYHEIHERPAFVGELHRMIKPGGRLMMVDFKAEETPNGPPVAHRVSVAEAVSDFEAGGFKHIETASLSANLYRIVFEA